MSDARSKAPVRLGDVLLCGGFVACLLLPVPPGAALLAGVALALTLGHGLGAYTRRLTPRLLQASVIGLGAGMDLRVVARAGLQGVGYTVVGIAACLALGVLLARLLGVRRDAGLLVSIGTAICGGSAIAAAAPVLGARDEDTTVALATVFLLNGVALLLFPWIGQKVGLSPPQFGLWAALAIHDTSSVVGAALSFSPEALQTATVVKLARALWIVPLVLGLSAWRGGGARPKLPLFILGFLLAAALNTYAAPLRALSPYVVVAARHGLVATLLLVGAALSRQRLREAGPRPLLQGLLLWIIVGGGTLLAVVSAAA